MWPSCASWPQRRSSSDLWQQYNELGGANGGNKAYIAALSNLDGDMSQYSSDNTDDELSHAASTHI